jgi:serine/threonine protein kinase
MHESIPENGCDIRIARQILRQVFETIAAMHDTGYAHGDIKPENILAEGINPKVRKLIDSVEKRIKFENFTGKAGKFAELSRTFERDVLNKVDSKRFDVENAQFDVDEDVLVHVSDFGTCKVSTAGISEENTVYYSGVEGLLGIEISDNRATDVWAMACTAWEIVTGEILFNWEDADDDDELQPQSTLEMIMRTLGGKDTALLDMLRRTTIYNTPPRGSGVTNMVSNPILTAEGLLKGVLKLKPRPLLTLMATTLKRSIIEEHDMVLFIDMMYAMLEYDPSKRPTARQILNHPFFTEDEGEMIRE